MCRESSYTSRRWGLYQTFPAVCLSIPIVILNNISLWGSSVPARSCARARTAAISTRLTSRGGGVEAVLRKRTFRHQDYYVRGSEENISDNKDMTSAFEATAYRSKEAQSQQTVSSLAESAIKICRLVYDASLHWGKHAS